MDSRTNKEGIPQSTDANFENILIRYTRPKSERRVFLLSGKKTRF